MSVSKIVVPPKSSILIRVSIINHPFWGIPIFRNTHIGSYKWVSTPDEFWRIPTWMFGSLHMEKNRSPDLHITQLAGLVVERFKPTHLKNTPWKINMEPENDGLEDDFPFQLGDF